MISGALDAFSNTGKKNAPDNPITNRLSISPRLFLIAFVFMVIAFGIGVINDLRSEVYALLISDAFSMTVFLLSFLLFYVRKIKQHIALLFCLLEVVRNFYCGFLFVYVTDPPMMYLVEWMQQCLFITGLVAAVLGLSVNKNIALFFSVLGLVLQILFILAFPQDTVVKNQFLLNSFVITGNLIVVYYYRAMLERLVMQLDGNIRETEVLKTRAEALADLNRPFVVFGKNTAGLVHDFRNDVNTLYITAQTMQLNQARGRIPSNDELASMEKSVDNLVRRIDWVRYVTEVGEAPAEEWIDIRELVESAIYPFTISPELRGKIAFKVVMRGNPRVWGPRRQYLQIVDNVIRNSCEALADHHPPAADAYDTKAKLGSVSIVLRSTEDGVSLDFEDNGPGIPIPLQCAAQDCLNCNCFKIGQTTKAHGSGFGMVNMVEAIRNLEGGLKIRSVPNRGTKISITLPRGAPET